MLTITNKKDFIDKMRAFTPLSFFSLLIKVRNVMDMNHARRYVLG